MAEWTEIRLPDIGDFQEVDVIEVLVRVHDKVAAEDTLLTLETDKAVMDIPAPKSGVIREVKVAAGDKISKGDLIFLMEAESEDISESPVDENADVHQEGAELLTPAAVSTPALPVEKIPSEAPPASDAGFPKEPPPLPVDASKLNPAQLPLASPSVRRFARTLAVDLNHVEGSGRNGRILKEDVQTHVKARLQQASSIDAGPGFLSWPKIDFSRFGEIHTEPLSRIKKLSGANLHRNWRMIPHVTQHDEADITDMEGFRKESASQAEARGVKMTPLVFLIKACAAALKQYPQFKASLSEDGETLILKHYCHIGVAVDTPEGLLVPVLRHCDQKGLLELAVELGDLSARAREKKLKLEEMEGGCFSISSLGGIGGTGFTPIINAPEVAILGVSSASQKAVYRDGTFVPRLMLPLSLSYDHRVIDGADAVRFTRYLSRRLSDIRQLLL